MRGFNRNFKIFGGNFLCKKLKLYTITPKQPNLSSDPNSPLLAGFRSQAFPKARQGYGPQLFNNGILSYLTSKDVQGNATKPAVILSCILKSSDRLWKTLTCTPLSKLNELLHLRVKPRHHYFPKILPWRLRIVPWDWKP